MYDANNLKKLKKFAELAPDAWKAFQAFDKAALADGAIPAKTKELIAVAVAMTVSPAALATGSALMASDAPGMVMGCMPCPFL